MTAVTFPLDSTCMKNKQPEKVSEVDLDKMYLYELCRWSALEEAVNIIGDCANEQLAGV